MANLDDFLIFVKVAQFESISRAARSLGMPISTVSRRLSVLESNLGVSLLRRTTRRVTLTAQGREYFNQCGEPLGPSPSHARKPVVALIFPKSAREDPSHLDRLQVLGAFEPELGGDSQPYRGTPLGREGLPIEIKCQDRLWVQCAGHVDAGRIPIETSEAHKGCAKVCSDPLKKCSQRHPAPAPDLAPALDADVASDLLDLRQRAQRRDCPGSLF